jgi:hypothetical protein
MEFLENISFKVAQNLQAGAAEKRQKITCFFRTKFSTTTL